VRASPHHTGDVFAPAGFNWPDTATLGRLDLATVPNGLPAAERQRIRDSVVAGAQRYLAILDGQAYGLPLPADAYFWGATSNNINNAIVLATAYDLTGDVRYRDGALQGMDYIFGRNALNHSFVTGWGTRASRNQHSRLYAHQLDPSSPNPPAGSLAGGPNTGLQDPFAAALLAGCVGQFCYVDDIQSWSTNEVAINWNSALAWMASFLADQGDGRTPPAAPCRVDYRIDGQWPGGFIAQVTVTNTGASVIDGWTLSWAFTGAQAVAHGWSAGFRQDGATVTAANLSWNRQLRPGRSVTFGFLGSTALANPEPELFRLNGSACP